MIKNVSPRLQAQILLCIILTLFLLASSGPAHAQDREEPVFHNINISPSSGSPDDIITVAVSATDDVELAGGIVVYLSPKGAEQVVFLTYDKAQDKLVGDYKIGYYDVPGTWEPVLVIIWDTSENVAVAFGFWDDLSSGNITVINPHPDLTPPVFNSIQLSTTQTNPGGKVNVVVNASDSESGLNFAYVTWWHGWDLIDAILLPNKEKGTLEADLYIPIDQALGTYRLREISIYDGQVNEYFWSSDAGPKILGKDLVLDGDPDAPVAGFTDVHPGNWFAEDVLFLVEYDLISGYPDNTFRPANSVTRAEFAKMICQALGWGLQLPMTPSFGDVKSDNWAFRYIETAKAHGAINGYPGGVFKPNDKITRAEICKMLVVAYDIDLDSGGINFLDVPKDHWARQYIITARNYELVSGYAGNMFKPNASATRAEAARMINKSYEWSFGYFLRNLLLEDNSAPLSDSLKANILNQIPEGIKNQDFVFGAVSAKPEQ